MKIKKILKFHPAAIAALGVFLGRGAQADTILNFDVLPADQTQNNPVIQTFGDYATASSDGIAVSGFGTPNIGLTWAAIGGGAARRWDYYIDSVWSAGQMEASSVGNSHTLTFTPDSVSARVVVKSFNLHPYYVFADFGERFTYDVSIFSGTNLVSGPVHTTFQSDATKNHPISMNYTGAPGQTLKLRITRAADVLSSGETVGDQFDIAVDDIRFGQLPETAFSAGPQVVSVTPVDDTIGLPAIASPPYAASITNGPTLTVAAPIQLRLDGTLLAPSISSSGGLTNVTYPGAVGLLTNGPHVYTLTYADNLGAIYTNEVVFNVNYQTLPPDYASPLGSGSHRGFTYRTVSASTEATNNLAGSIARAKAQLNGTLINPATSLPYTNSAMLGTNADLSFNIETVLNFNDAGFSAGNFPDDTGFPGLDVFSGPYNGFSTEANLFLELPAGYYRLGVNSDDGFEFSAQPPQGVPGSPIVLGSFDNGRGAFDTLFDFFVPTGGVYPMRLIYFEIDQTASCELFSVTNLATGDKVLINDPANGNAIKSFLVVPPRIFSAVKNGSNINIQWAYGNPPFQVQFKNDITSPTWNNSGATTTSRTASVPISLNSGFIRVVGSP